MAKPRLSDANTQPSALTHQPALLSVARKRETKKFCLTPRLSLQLYYIPVLAPQVTGQVRAGAEGTMAMEWRGQEQRSQQRREGRAGTHWQPGSQAQGPEPVP